MVYFKNKNPQYYSGIGYFGMETDGIFYGHLVCVILDFVYM
jgi:hypothetical protein